MKHIIAKNNSALGNLLSLVQSFMVALGSNFANVACAGVFIVGVILAGPATAQDKVVRAEAWFNKIKSIKADFVQIASDGTSAEGKLLFRRPSQMKITYQNGGGGKGLQLITSKIWLHVDRPDEKLVTSYLLSETPLSLILKAKVSLRLDGYETKIISSSPGVVQILISKEEGQGAGELTLEFSEKPFELRRWVVVDAVGTKTSITLLNPTFDVPIANAVFKIPDYTGEN